ncbi:MAG: DUF924 domain-containing protein [Deltaproteobacteria bacterium]|nr:MAG: DUF924 domain-containing protein [Deltaproteobacteria bacterium]
MTPSEPWSDVLDYWFGETHADGRFDASKNPLWWGHAEATDAEIRERFLPRIEAASRGELDWAGEPLGRLGLVILLDQMRRNAFRDTPAMYAEDPRARSLVHEGLEAGVHRELHPIHRLFFYLPLEHSESLVDQERCVALCRELAAEVRAEQGTYDNFVDYAIRHRDIVARFGRFPHRNAILGRESTQEEQLFLTQPGSSF